MLRSYEYPIKGTFYYSAELAWQQQLLTPNTQLKLVAEPSNAYDANAIQIWLADDSYLLGYVPRQLARLWHPFLNTPSAQTAQLTLALAKGKSLRLECKTQLEVTFWQHPLYLAWSLWIKYHYRWRFRLKHLFH